MCRWERYLKSSRTEQRTDESNNELNELNIEFEREHLAKVFADRNS